MKNVDSIENNVTIEEKAELFDYILTVYKNENNKGRGYFQDEWDLHAYLGRFLHNLRNPKT